MALVEKKIWIEPKMSSNGTWMADGYSCRGSGLDNLNNLYQVFNGTSTKYLDKFNENTWIEICLPQATEVAGCYMRASPYADGYFPETGNIYYSDDGKSYIKCGSWVSRSDTAYITVYVTEGSGAHRIWRFMSTGRPPANKWANAVVSVAKLFKIETASISGITEALVTYRPHGGPDIRKLDLYFLYKQDDKVDTFKIPYGIGGTIHAYILQKPNTSGGYLNMYDTEKVQAIVLGNDRYPLKRIQSFNDIPLFNNNTTGEGG